MAEKSIPEKAMSDMTLNRFHAKIYVQFLRDVTDNELHEMKEYLSTGGDLSRNEVSKATTQVILWETMNRCGVISRMNYKKLKEMLQELNLKGLHLWELILQLEEEYEKSKDSFEDQTAAGNRPENTTISDNKDHDSKSKENDQNVSSHPSGQDKYCTLCHFKSKGKKMGHRECSECDKLTLCLDCSDNHEATFQHCMVPIGSGKDLCKKHDDQPRLLKYCCVDCDGFICDVCLAIDHQEHKTFKLNATGKSALENVPKAAEVLKFLLAELSTDFQSIEPEVSKELSEITSMGTERIQEILLIYNQQMKAASKERDVLIHDILTDTDCMDVAMSLNAQNKKEGTITSSSLALTLLKEKRDQFPQQADNTDDQSASDDESVMMKSANFNQPDVASRSAPIGGTRCANKSQDYSKVKPKYHKQKEIRKSGEWDYEKPDSPPPCPDPNLYKKLGPTKEESRLHAVRRSNSKTEADAFDVRPKRHSSIKTRAIPSMNLYRGINGYELEDCGNTSWDFLPRFTFSFSLALMSDTRQAFLTSNSTNPHQDLADTIIIFNSDGSSLDKITDKVQGSKRMVVNENGEIVLLQANPLCIRTLSGDQGGDGENVINIKELQDPISIDIDEQDSYYYIVHGGSTQAKLAVVDDAGTVITSLPVGDHRYVNCAGNGFIFTLSRTSISSYEWRGGNLCLNKTDKHDVKDFEIVGSCCNGYGDLFMVGWIKTIEKPREIRLYQLLEDEDNWTLARLDTGDSMKSNQAPRISYWNGHILIAYKENMKTCCSRRFKLYSNRRKSITVYDDTIIYDDTVLPPSYRSDQ